MAASCCPLQRCCQLPVEVQHAVLLPLTAITQQVLLEDLEGLGARLHSKVADVTIEHRGQGTGPKDTDVGAHVNNGVT